MVVARDEENKFLPTTKVAYETTFFHQLRFVFQILSHLTRPKFLIRTDDKIRPGNRPESI